MSVETATEDVLPPSVPTRVGVLQQLSISAYWFATNLHWLALFTIIASQMKHIVPKDPAGAQGLIIGAGSWVALLVPVIAGALSDRSMSRWGRRRPFMVAGIAINLLGLFTLWYAGLHSNFWLFLVGYLIVQFGNNLAGAAYNGVIPDLIPARQHGEASGYMAVMSQLGTGLGAFAAGQLMGSGKVTESYLLVGVLLVVFLAITAFGMKEKPLERKPEPFNWVTLLKSFWIDPRKYPDFAWVWLTRALFTMGIWCVMPNIQYYLADVVHESNPEKSYSILMPVILVTATVTGMLGGKISDKIGRKRVVYIANTMVAITAVAFVFSHSMTYTLIVGAIYGLGYGAYYSVDWALGCDVLPDQENAAAKDMGVWHIAMVLPQSLAPALASWMLTSIGTKTLDPVTGVAHYPLIAYQVTFGASAVFLLLGAILLHNVREKRDRVPAMRIEPETA